MGAVGFILQPTYRLEKGRAVVHLYGVLRTGEAFLVRDDRFSPYFYIERDHLERAVALGAPRAEPTDRITMDGKATARVEVSIPSDTPFLRARLNREGIRCYEADIRFAMRFLIDLGIRSSLEIEGGCQTRVGLGRVYSNPVLRPAEWAPKLSVLSLDIETDPTASRLLSVALHGCGASEVLVVDPGGRSVAAPATSFPCERELLQALVRRLGELDPDVLTGWNVIDFDLRVLLQRAAAAGVPLPLGRGPETLRLRPSRFPWASNEALLTGRLALDGIQLLRGAFVSMDDYSLDSVARKVLGEGKTIRGKNRAEEILALYADDLDRFVEYNLTDARLVLEILDKLHLLELSVERSLLTGLPVDRVAGSIAAFDFLYLSELHRRGIVAPSVDASRAGEASPGGHVLEPEPGLYRNVLVFDFKSLYPSLMRTFQIDPLGFVAGPQPGEDLIMAPNGACFRRERSILTEMLDHLFPRREAAKEAGDKVASHAIKILMNSFYGVLGTSACRFHRPELAGAITGFGRDMLLWSKNWLEENGCRVLYGDTDSLFVLSREDDPEAAEAAGRRLAASCNHALARRIRRDWKVESRLELQLERLYLRLHLPPMRGRAGGARKRYTGLIGRGDAVRIAFVGMEAVRRDWTELAKRVQRELYRRLFADEGMEGYLRRIVSEVREGKSDGLLVYRKALRRNLESYKATTPPHVAAARKLSGPPGRMIEYVMTTAGPEPAAERKNPIDREHYVQKQIRPIAEPILELLGVKFDKAIGDDRQLELF